MVGWARSLESPALVPSGPRAGQSRPKPPRNDCLEFGEVEVADRVQRLGGGAVLEVLRQCLQGGGIMTLQRDQLGDSVRQRLAPLR
jgi:hypothetical protein